VKKSSTAAVVAAVTHNAGERAHDRRSSTGSGSELISPVERVNVVGAAPPKKGAGVLLGAAVMCVTEGGGGTVGATPPLADRTGAEPSPLKLAVD
jgi:hypothetical protein